MVGIAAKLDQVAIWIAQVDRVHWAAETGLAGLTQDILKTTRIGYFADLAEGHCGFEANIHAAGEGAGGMGRQFLPREMDVDLEIRPAQFITAVLFDKGKPKGLIESAAAREVGGGEDEMVNFSDHGSCLTHVGKV